MLISRFILFQVYPDRYFPELNCGYCQLRRETPTEAYAFGTSFASTRSADAAPIEEKRRGTVDTAETTKAPTHPEVAPENEEQLSEDPEQSSEPSEAQSTQQIDE